PALQSGWRLCKAQTGRRMTGPSLLEYCFIVRTAVTADGDDDPKPHVPEHPDRFRVLLPPLACTQVVGLGPRAVLQTGKGKRPQCFPQGMNAGAAKVHGAGGSAGSRDRSGARLALGDVRIAIPVAIIAQFSDHPGGEKISSVGQAAVELAVRMERQYPLNLAVVGVDLFEERLQ